MRYAAFHVDTKNDEKRKPFEVRSKLLDILRTFFLSLFFSLVYFLLLYC